MLALGFVLGLGWLVYAPALSGALLYDDTSNLSGLATVDDLPSALIFILSGEAGPLGRPLALATFAAQAGTWGSPPEPLFLVNILIHLANGSLLFWALLRLGRAGGAPEGEQRFVALAATAIWVFMPLLASSSLMVVQRMTTLSASFVLLGLIGYLHTRSGLDRRPVRSLVGMTAALVLGTGLAVLAKESGALLPVYVLVLEATVLPRPAQGGRRWQVWKAIFLMLPAIALVAYLASLVPYEPAVALRRDFTAWERLMTEARILWRYLFNAFVPQPGEFGPFHDGYPVARTIFEPLTFFAVWSWIALVAAAIAWRRRFPWFGFAVLWFVGGHLLESTTVPLELYFEHRNYLPIAGPIFALCAFLAKAGRGEYSRLVYAGVGAYALLSAFVLFTHTTLWGDPPYAARYWEKNFPYSVRAASTAAHYRLEVEGVPGVTQSLRRLAAEYPGAAFVRIPELSLSCVSSPEQDHGALVGDLRSSLPRADFNYTVVTMLSELFTTATRVDCNGVDGEVVLELANALRANPRYTNDATFNRLYHELAARISRREGRFETALTHLREAAKFGLSPDLNMMIVTTLADARRFDEAREFIEEARRNAPWRPMQRYIWLKRLDRLSTYLETIVGRGP